VGAQRGSRSDGLAVALNRDRLNGVTAPGSFVAEGDFTVRLTNEGSPVHAHLRFKGPVADVASVPESNHYLEPDQGVAVPVDVATRRRPTTTWSPGPPRAATA
jgi:hypothetical protein